jgi:hypothetical protein
MLPRANSALRRTVRGGFFGVGRQAEFGIQRLEEPDGVEVRIVEQRCRRLQRGRPVPVVIDQRSE